MIQASSITLIASHVCATSHLTDRIQSDWDSIHSAAAVDILAVVGIPAAVDNPEGLDIPAELVGHRLEEH